MRPLALTLTLAALALGCGDSTGPHPTARALTEPQVRITVGGQTLRIDNVGLSTVGFAAFDPGTLAIIDWAPCSDIDRCGGLRPGYSATIQYSDIHGYQQGDSSAVVFYWRMVPGGYAPGSFDALRSTEVELAQIVALSSSR